MKKSSLLLLLVFAIILSLFSACNNNSTSTQTAPPTATSASTAAATAAPTAAPTAAATEQPSEEAEDESPYNYAVGKYTVNDRGFPTAPYEYELPISTTDEVLTYWTTIPLPEYIPEDGYGAMEFPRQLEEMTGINVEYIHTPSDVKQQQYSVLLAADNLYDIMTAATAYHSGTYEKAIEDGFWVNIYDYKEYCPNFIYQATYDSADDSLYENVFYKEDMIVRMVSMYTYGFINVNNMTRGDWLARLGLTNDDIVTYDDMYNMFIRFKNEIDTCEYPWPMRNTIDVAGSYAFTAFDTLPAVSTFSIGPFYVIDGVVQSSHSTDRDREFMTLLNKWYNDGIIDPNWSSYTSNNDFKDKISTSKAALISISPGEMKDYEDTSNDPNAEWVPLHKPLREPGQTLHLGGEITRMAYGSVVITGRCENVPLAVTWCDYRFSPSGSEYMTWGPENLLFYKNENGDYRATEFALTHPAGLSWVIVLNSLFPTTDIGMIDNDRKYAYDGGDRPKAVHIYWNDYNYDGAYKWPVGVNFTAEQQDEIALYRNEIITYVSENYLAFLDGSKNLADWDSYVDELMNTVGLKDVLAIYQTAYDTYIAERY